MTINRYERGGLPTKSQSDYLKLLIENEDRFIEKVKESYENNNITEKTYKKIVSEGQEENISKKRVQENIRRYLKEVLNRKPDIYNGYKSLDLEKVENIISYIASKVKKLTITSLNKYLWYIDMLSFNKRAVAITGLTYQNQKFGPTIVYKNMMNYHYQMINTKEKKRKFCEKLLHINDYTALYINIVYKDIATAYERCTCNDASKIWQQYDEYIEKDKIKKINLSKINKLFKNNNLGKRQLNSTFENYKITNKNKKVYENVKKYVEKLIKGTTIKDFL